MLFKDNILHNGYFSEPKHLFRLYIGNLKPDCPEEVLRSLFAEHGVEVGDILVKRSYAFVDCPDQANVDLGIDKLNGNEVLFALFYAFLLLL